MLLLLPTPWPLTNRRRGSHWRPEEGQTQERMLEEVPSVWVRGLKRRESSQGTTSSSRRRRRCRTPPLRESRRGVGVAPNKEWVVVEAACCGRPPHAQRPAPPLIYSSSRSSRSEISVSIAIVIMQPPPADLIIFITACPCCLCHRRRHRARRLLEITTIATLIISSRSRGPSCLRFFACGASFHHTGRRVNICCH